MKNVLILAGLIIYLQGASQGKHYTAISIFDKMPAVQSETVLGTNKKLNLQQYRGKWIILDFWSIRCAACIEAMPRLETLQAKFRDHIQIVMVTKNSQVEVRQLFTRIKKQVSGIPVVISDTVLHQLFPHEAEPHHVWIDPEGVIRYIAAGQNTNTQNIKDALSGKNLHLQLKADLPGDDDSKPLVEYTSSITPGQLSSYSMLLKGLFFRINSNRIEIFKDSITGLPYRILALNTPVSRLCTIAFGRELFQIDINPLQMQNNNRILIEAKDPSPFTITTDSSKLDEWLYNNYWSYELKLPPADIGSLLHKMQADLQVMLPYSAVIEKRKIKCLVLIRTNDTMALKTAADTNQAFCTYSRGQLVIRNTNIKNSLYKWLLIINAKSLLPIVDATADDKAVDMTITCQMDDIPALRKQLLPYGLDLVEQERLIDMLIVKEK